MAIDPTVGGADANSFVTLAEMDAFAAEEIGMSAWVDARAESPSPAEAILISAARRVSQEKFRGIKSSSTQALAFPRDGLTDEDGYSIGADVIPERAKRAQMKLAAVLAGDDEWLADTGLLAFSRAKVGPIEVDIRAAPSGDLPADVRRELAPFIFGSAINFRILRG